ncbi:hypothetical protein [Rhizobium miluonense]|uniref:aromatic-ring hydroxylase C-terminal domain-containing protein n=1 Tax=Rhizobium miluonense TaxID=411945 RepID=UPI0038620B5E
MEEGGALLVRPDGVIAWRQKQAVSGKQDVNTLLSSVLGAVLGHTNGESSVGATGAAA